MATSSLAYRISIAAIVVTVVLFAYGMVRPDQGGALGLAGYRLFAATLGSFAVAIVAGIMAMRA